MNETLRVLMERKSVRVFEKRPIGPEEKHGDSDTPRQQITECQKIGNKRDHFFHDQTDRIFPFGE